MSINNSHEELFLIEKPGVNCDIDDVCEIFHEQTKYYRELFQVQLKDIGPYLCNINYIARGAAGRTEYRSYPKLTLPNSIQKLGSLADAIKSRESCQEFSEKAMSLESLSSLLHHALRPNRSVAIDREGFQFRIHKRPYPSPGALFATEFYLFLNRVSDVPACLVHYNPYDHCLDILKAQDGSAFGRTGPTNNNPDSAAAATAVDTAAVVLVATLVPQRCTQKYGPRGYRMALLEAGHACQNICLVAASLGLSSLPYSAFFDDELESYLGIDGVTETVVATVIIGINELCS
jgi:SagB-type dehydrogenase family enzyme